MQDKDGKIRWELYHLERDPMESKDLVGNEPEKAGEMKSGLEAWQRSVVRSMYGLDY
jgi:hypothetical protein